MGKPRNIGPEIKKLHKKGYSYNKIVEILGCSKGTVGYHLTPNEKRRAKRRLVDLRKDPLYRRSMQWNFESKRSKKLLEQCNGKRSDAIRLIMKNQNYLDPYTGRPLLSESEVHLDHKIPQNSPHFGSNEITNCEVLNPESNQAKSNMTPDEFLNFCKEVVSYNNKKIKNVYSADTNKLTEAGGPYKVKVTIHD